MIYKKNHVSSFLSTNIKDISIDPDKSWITTWNHFLNRMRLFFRWLCNMNKLSIGNYGVNDACNNERPIEDWSSPDFI